MLRLTWGLMAEMVRPVGILLLLLWLLFAANMGANLALGSGWMGDFLALASVPLIFLLFRVCHVVGRRAREDWAQEEALRNPSGWRMPLVEAMAGLLLMGCVWGMGSIVGLGQLFYLTKEPAIHPLAVGKLDSGNWVFVLGQPAPPGSSLDLIFEWSGLPNPAEKWRGPKPGEPYRRPLTPEEAAAGRAEVFAYDAATPHPDFARLVVPRPRSEGAPALLGNQVLFLFPLMLLALFLTRQGVRPFLSSAGALSLGSVALRPPSQIAIPVHDLPTFAAWCLAGIHDLLPNIHGLWAVGATFHLDRLPVSSTSLASWLVLGGLAWLGCWRFPDKRNQR